MHSWYWKLSSMKVLVLLSRNVEWKQPSHQQFNPNSLEDILIIPQFALEKIKYLFQYKDISVIKLILERVVQLTFKQHVHLNTTVIFLLLRLVISCMPSFTWISPICTKFYKEWIQLTWKHYKKYGIKINRSWYTKNKTPLWKAFNMNICQW